jgi:hypothetical protein
MPKLTGDSWRGLPARSGTFAELAAEAVPGVDGAFIAVDHDGSRHLLLPADQEMEPVSDERSRGIRVLTRPLSVEGRQERLFVDMICPTLAGQDVFNLVGSAVIEQIELGVEPPDAVRTTLGRWRRFWSGVPTSGLTGEELRGLFGELWFLCIWLLPHGVGHVRHWLGPTGARNDFAWPGLAIEAKATTSVRGHVHWINGIDQLDPPEDGELFVFSLRMREEPTASNSIVSLITSITGTIGNDEEALDTFESRLAQAGYSPLDAERYAETRFRVIGEHLFRVGDGFPRLSATSFASDLSAGIERIEYEINLDACPDLIVAKSPSGYAPPIPPVAA